jgi:hypothetical protein
MCFSTSLRLSGCDFSKAIDHLDGQLTFGFNSSTVAYANSITITYGFEDKDMIKNLKFVLIIRVPNVLLQIPS